MTNLVSQIKAAATLHKNAGNKHLSLLKMAVDETLDNRNWDPLATFIQVMPNQKVVKGVINKTIGGITLTKDKEHPTGFRFKLGDNFGPTEDYDGLNQLVTEGEKLGGKEVKAFAGIQPPEFNLEKTIERFKKTLEANGYDATVSTKEV